MTLQEIDKRLSQIPNYCYYLAEHRVNDHVLHLNFDRWYQLGNEFNRNAWIYTYGTERQSGRTLAMARNIVIRLSDVIAGNLDCVRVVVFPYLMAHYKTAIRYVLSQSEDFLHDKNRNITFKGKVVIRFYSPEEVFQGAFRGLHCENSVFIAHEVYNDYKRKGKSFETYELMAATQGLYYNVGYYYDS